MATNYTHKSGYVIKVEVFSWHTELSIINPKTDEVHEHFDNVVGVERIGNWLHWTAVNRMHGGDRYQYKAELLENSRPLIDVNINDIRAAVKVLES